MNGTDVKYQPAAAALSSLPQINMPQVDIASRINVAAAEMRQLIPEIAAREILPRFKNVEPEFKRSLDGTKEIVTAADIAASSALLSVVRPKYSGSSSEEHLHDDRFSSEMYWLIDPVDGTTEFCRGAANDYAVLASLITKVRDSWHPTASIVYRPSLGEMWSVDATGNVSRTINGVDSAIAAPTRDSVRGWTRATDPSAKVPALYQKIGRDLDLDAATIPGGGSGASLADLLNDRVNLVVQSYNYSKEWDIAPAEPLIRARGGFICDLDGNDLTFNRRDPYNRRGYVMSLTFTKEEIMPYISGGLIENKLRG